MADGLYLRVITNKTLLRNGNCPKSDPITKMGIAYTVERKVAIQWLSVTVDLCRKIQEFV